MHQAQWSPERPLPPPVSLASQSHHEKPPEVTCTSRGNPGFPASTRERPRETFFNTSRGHIPLPWLGSNDALPLATRMETRLPWRPTRGSLTSPSYLVRNRTLGPPLENNPEIPPPCRSTANFWISAQIPAGSGWTPRWFSPHSPSKPCRFPRRNGADCAMWVIASCSAATFRTSPTATAVRSPPSPGYRASTTTGCAECSTATRHICSQSRKIRSGNRSAAGRLMDSHQRHPNGARPWCAGARVVSSACLGEGKRLASVVVRLVRRLLGVSLLAVCDCAIRCRSEGVGGTRPRAHAPARGGGAGQDRAVGCRGCSGGERGAASLRVALIPSTRFIGRSITTTLGLCSATAAETWSPSLH